MASIEQHGEIVRDLKTQVEFLGAQLMVYESTELGRQRLRRLIEVVERAATLLEEHALAPAKSDGKGATAETGATPTQERVDPPADADDLDGWLALLLQEPNNVDASVNVERLFQAAKAKGEWEHVVDVYLARVELASTAADRVHLLEEVAKIYELQIGDLGKAFTALMAAFREEPANPRLPGEIQRYAEATEQWGQLVALLNELAPAAKDPAVASKLWLELARVYNERLERPDYAVASLWHALEKDVACADAWDELASIYKRKEQWTDLAHVLRRRLDATKDKQERIFFLLELADLHESRLDALMDARMLYEEVRQIDPNNADALANLEALLRRLELWEPLVNVLLHKAEHATEKEAGRHARWEAARLLRQQVEDPEGARTQLELLEPGDPENPELLRMLYEIYEELERQADFLRIAERRVKLVEDVALRISIYRRMVVELQADARMRARAADVLEKILELEPESEQTYRDLEVLYIQLEAWDELVSTYRRHANAAQSGPVKGEVLRAMAAVLDEKLLDRKAAVESLRESLTVDHEDLKALTYLSQLLDVLEEWVELVEVLSRRAELTEDETERVELHRRIGEIALSKLGEPEVAEKRLMKALELDPDNTGAMMALVELYRRRREWLRASNMLADAEKATGNRLEKARLLFESGEIQREHLENTPKAVELYSKAMLVDPEHVQAATVLADHYYDKSQYEEAEPLLDLLVRKVDEKDRKRRLYLHTRLGLASKQLKRAEKAMKHLDIARELDPTSLDVMQELADLKFHLEKWADAANLYQAILVAHRDALAKETLVEVYHRLGSVKMELGEKDKALNLFEKALEHDATYQPSVQAVLRIREEAEDYDRVVSTKRMMLEKTTAETDRHRLSVEIGDLYYEKLGQADKAVEFYEKALELKPDDRTVLHKLLEHYTTAENWPKAVLVIVKLAELEWNAANKAKYLYTAGLIYRDELKDQEAALLQFEACLETDFSSKHAFDAVERIHNQREDWKELTRATRRQLKRMPEAATPVVRIGLLDRLGTIYAENLQEMDTAVAAFEAADAMDPTNGNRKATLAKLYLQAGPDKVDKAIEQHHALLKQSPYKIQLYKDLTELYIRTKRKDETWCMCSALEFLKKASEKEHIFFERYRRPELVLAQRRITESQWRDLIRHPTESAKVDAILAAVCPPAALQNAQPHKAFRLKRHERLNPEEDSRPVFKLFVYASRIMEVMNPRPEIFSRPDQPQPIQVANATDKNALVPTWLVDPDKFNGRTDAEVLFDVSRELTFMRPERYLWRALVSQTDLWNVLYAALAIMVPDAPVPSDTSDVKKMMQYLKKAVPPMYFEQLLPTAKELLSAGKDESNLAHWITATQKTALRAALLLTNDFQTVAKKVGTESDSVTGIPAKDRVGDLLLFSVSPEYFQLRKHLGFALE